jgi:hypothetical protein
VPPTPPGHIWEPEANLTVEDPHRLAEGGAGYVALITPAPVIMNLLKYAFDRDGVPYASP